MKRDARTQRWRMTRRGFLIGLGIVGGGLALGATLGLPAARLALADLLGDGTGPPASFPKEPAIWFAIQPNGRVVMAMPKVEMGQGVHTALAQLAAEELGIAWEQISVTQSSSIGPVRDPAGTSASYSMMGLFPIIRETAATLREMLRAAGAEQLGIAQAEIEQGFVIDPANPARRIGFGELAAQPREWQAPEEAAPLTPPDRWRIIGQPVSRLDLPAKVRGAAIYGYDARVEGMLYGAVARPPRLGAKLRRAAPGTALERRGVVQVVIRDGVAGVVAESRLTAYAALNDLDLEWELPPPFTHHDLEERLAAQARSGTPIQQHGDPAAAMHSARLVEAVYQTPLAAHANLEPQAALVDVQPDRVRAWVSTQSPVQVAESIAATLGRPADTVEVTPTYLGGGFGRKLLITAANEAAILSAAVGKPVHVGWTRTEEFRHSYLRPPTYAAFRAALDAQGNIIALEQRHASGSVLFDFIPAPLRWLLGSDFGAWRGARLVYAIPNLLVTSQTVDLPVPTGPWRGLGLLANVFAVESFIDELAHAAGSDPLEFRLRHLPESELGQRFRATLLAVAEMAGWGQPAPAGRARGIACSVDMNTVAAHIAEVGYEGDKLRVYRVWAAVDPGLAINPDGLAAQTEGGIMMGLSATLFEQVTISEGRIDAGNFDRYPLLTIADAPEVAVQILRSGDQPFGGGEPPMGPIAAAVANAVFALTGERKRRLPIA
ncbi:molybdopterin cofactor-binding domain-containing protein [uncultured Chloroflexus sp.]|uniref:xanthine dehydrogenase family protein molybdopterin-binding subunit n=1 Tax=uncultured Chloroflexus sp. TaxID=214040 RepID=UPI00261E34B7|nr:molybdopterin cofactor-binding domain-containing protein [uncultured Chloroflexus sp.]